MSNNLRIQTLQNLPNLHCWQWHFPAETLYLQGLYAEVIGHTVEEIHLIKKHCTERERTIALRAVNTNGFSGQSEMVTICILASSDEHIRQDAVT